MFGIVRNVNLYRAEKINGTVMQIEKAVVNDRLCVSKVFWKFCIPTTFNFAVIYP